MKILLTNDDGINAEGIYAIYLQLKQIADVTVIAPTSQRSAISHAITLRAPIWYEKIHLNDKFTGYRVDGTPADCIKVGLKLILKTKPDLVVSGINLGPNEGCSVFYSGTVAGAREGAILGIPSLALSLSTYTKPDFSFAAELGRKLVQSFKKTRLPKNTFLNINVPGIARSQIKGIKITEQNLIPIHTKFHKKRIHGTKNYVWMTAEKPKIRKHCKKDTDALNQNFVTITPIICDTTDYDFIDVLKTWNLKLY